MPPYRSRFPHRPVLDSHPSANAPVSTQTTRILTCRGSIAHADPGNSQQPRSLQQLLAMPPITPNQNPRPGRRAGRRRDRAGTEPAPDAAAGAHSYHDGAAQRPTSTRPRTSSNQGPLTTNREALGQRGHWHVTSLAAALMITAAAALCACYFLTASPLNDPISTLNPEKVAIKADPFPMADLVTVAELYANASDDLYLPHRTSSNITLGLDAPGLTRVNVASWLPKVWFDPTGIFKNANKTRGLPAEKAPIFVDLANVTVTLSMLHTLSPVLVYAATDLLTLGLGPDHPEYSPLRDSLTPFLSPPRHEHLTSTAYAARQWDHLGPAASFWPVQARRAWLGTLVRELEGIAAAGEKRRATRDDDGGNHSARLSIGSWQPPTFEQLLEHDQGQQQAIPRLLAGLPISREAFAQLAAMLELVSGLDRRRREVIYTDYGLGMDFPDYGKLCLAGNLLDALVATDGQCHGNEHIMPLPFAQISRDDVGDEQYLARLWHVLCEADIILSSVAALAARVRDRVRAAVEERGGISLREHMEGYVRDGIARRTATLNHALDIFNHLLSSMRLQPRMLAAMAARMRRACILQDELRDRLRSLYSHQSAWWHVKWDTDSETASLTFVTLPAVEDTITQLRAAMARLEAQDEPLKGTWRKWEALRQLERKVLDGWIEKAGLGGLPLGMSGLSR